MGYYASGDGFIDFSGVLSEEDYEKVEKILSYVCECVDGVRTFGKDPDSNMRYTSFSIADNGKYYGYEVEDALEEISVIGKIESGEITYHGEDFEVWRFVFKNGKWVYEPGRIVFDEDDEPEGVPEISVNTPISL